MEGSQGAIERQRSGTTSACVQTMSIVKTFVWIIDVTTLCFCCLQARQESDRSCYSTYKRPFTNVNRTSLPRRRRRQGWDFQLSARRLLKAHSGIHQSDVLCQVWGRPI